MTIKKPTHRAGRAAPRPSLARDFPGSSSGTSGGRRRPKSPSFHELANEAAAVIEGKKGLDIEILDIHKRSPVASFFVICTGTSPIHMRTIASALSDHFKAKGRTIRPWTGSADSQWLIIDLGGVIVHVMGADVRAFYQLEELWSRSGIVYHM